MIGWKAWYPDKMYQSSECASCHVDEFRDLPAEGLQILIIYGDQVGKQRTRMVLNGADWYWPWDTIQSTSWDGTFENPPEGIDKSLLKKGTKISDRKFKKLWKKAWEARWP